MTPTEFEKLPIIGLQDTGTSDPTGYTDLQAAFLPYIDLYHTALWLLFFGIGITLVTRFILIPLLKGAKT